MAYLSYTQLNEYLNSPDSVYNNLTYKVIKENIIIPSQQTHSTIKHLNTYTFKFAPNKLIIANQIILSIIQNPNHI